MEYGIDGLKDQSRKPHNIKNVKVTEELEKLVLELRLNNRFGPMRIRFRLKRKYGVSLGTKTIYNILKIHKLNVLSVKLNSVGKKYPSYYLIGVFYRSLKSAVFIISFFFNQRLYMF